MQNKSNISIISNYINEIEDHSSILDKDVLDKMNIVETYPSLLNLRILCKELQNLRNKLVFRKTDEEVYVKSRLEKLRNTINGEENLTYLIEIVLWWTNAMSYNTPLHYIENSFLSNIPKVPPSIDLSEESNFINALKMSVAWSTILRIMGSGYLYSTQKYNNIDYIIETFFNQVDNDKALGAVVASSILKGSIDAYNNNLNIESKLPYFSLHYMVNSFKQAAEVAKYVYSKDVVIHLQTKGYRVDQIKLKGDTLAIVACRRLYGAGPGGEGGDRLETIVAFRGTRTVKLSDWMVNCNFSQNM